MSLFEITIKFYFPCSLVLFHCVIIKSLTCRFIPKSLIPIRGVNIMGLWSLGPSPHSKEVWKFTRLKSSHSCKPTNKKIKRPQRLPIYRSFLHICIHDPFHLGIPFQPRNLYCHLCWDVWISTFGLNLAKNLSIDF